MAAAYAHDTMASLDMGLPWTKNRPLDIPNELWSEASLGHNITLHYVVVNTVVLIGLIGMHKTGCCGETRPVLHVPSSS